MIKPEVLKKLTALLGPDRVKTSKEDLLSYSYDAFIAEYAPEAVVFPKTTQEVAEIMKIASAERVFITPRGSGSGLSAATLANTLSCSFMPFSVWGRRHDRFGRAGSRRNCLPGRQIEDWTSVHGDA